MPRIFPSSTLLLLAACPLVACHAQPEDSFGGGDSSPERPPAADGLGTPAGEPIAAGFDACPGAPQIGILQTPAGDCELGGALPGGWEAQRLFESGSPGLVAIAADVPDGLAGFCAYTWTGSGTESLEALHDAVDGYGGMSASTLGPDCRGQAPQGDGLEAETLSFALQDAFRENIGWVAGQALVGSTGARSPVAVGIPDTVSQIAADNPAIDPVNRHGAFIATLIGDIVCPDDQPGCPMSIHHTLAMPIDDWAAGPDPLRGGEHGTQGDLAMAVYQVVAEWRERRLADSEAAPRMVVNLSLGFQRRLDQTNFDGKGPAKALHAALEYASCNGVVLVAAAGNTEDASCPQFDEGPLAPASRESLAAPTPAECGALGVVPLDGANYPVFGPPSAYRPLVHGVIGVDEYDQPLPNTRPHSRPRLAALGSNAIGGTTAPFTDVLSGSSAAAAVVSGTAAMLWSYRPDLRPDEVMQLLHDTGYDLNATADFGLEGRPLSASRRVSVCAAVAAACDDPDPSVCPALDCPAQAPLADGNLGDFFGEVDLVVDDPANTVGTFVGGPGISPICVAPDSDNLSDPQPPVPICANCNLQVKAAGSSASDDTLNMTLEQDYLDRVQSVTLAVSDGSETVVHTVGAAAVSSLNTRASDVTRVNLATLSGARSASLTFTLDDGVQQRQVIPTERD